MRVLNKSDYCDCLVRLAGQWPPGCAAFHQHLWSSQQFQSILSQPAIVEQGLQGHTSRRVKWGFADSKAFSPMVLSCSITDKYNRH